MLKVRSFSILRRAHQVAVDTQRDNADQPETEPLVVVTMLALQDLIALPIAFYEFVMLCRDRSHKLWSNTESILRERNLLEQDGQPHSSIRNIVTAAVAGDGLAMVLGSPLK